MKFIVFLVITVCLTACNTQSKSSQSTADSTDKVFIEPLTVTIVSDTLTTE